MKNNLTHGVKRALSIALALVLLCGTLFTANATVTTDTESSTATTFPEGTIDVLEYGQYLIDDLGSSSQYYDSKLADSGETGADWDHAIIIDSAEELVYLCKMAGNETKDKYYKVADGIAGFDLSGGKIDLNGTLKDNLEKIQSSGKNHSGNTPGFQGHFDGNGATVYGVNVPGGSYAGLFPCVKGEVEIKNINVTLSYFKGFEGVGGIVGYHTADDICTVTIEKCSVTNSYLEVTGTGYQGVGAILGYGASAPTLREAQDKVDYNGDGDMEDTIYRDCPYIINNCYVNLDATNVVSCVDTSSYKNGDRPSHGGIAGLLGSNKGKFNNCVVIGINPYAIIDSSEKNNSQHSAEPDRFSNVYTTDDVLLADVKISGKFTRTYAASQINGLSDTNLKGTNAVRSMNLDWANSWNVPADGEYPTPNQKGTTDSTVSFWSGSAASEYAGGTGTESDPYIIATADQLYKALSEVTYTTSTTGDLAVNAAESVAGAKSMTRILKQDSTTEYVPKYEPYYYKVADGVTAFYLNTAVYGLETLDTAKTLATSGTARNWQPGKSFVGHLDGNGVTIYGMYCKNGGGLIQKLDGTSTVKNINFNACYSSSSGVSALLTTNLGSYLNDSTTITVSNISVRNSYIGSTGTFDVTKRTDNNLYQMNATVGGIISTGNTAEKLTISNCLFDGTSCERAIGGSNVTISMDEIGGIISGGTNMNNVTINSCLSLGAPVVDEVFISKDTELYYSRYATTAGFQVHFYDCYSNVALNGITTTFTGKYDRLGDIVRLTAADTYAVADMPRLDWNNWALTAVSDTRTIPMPTVNTADTIGDPYALTLSNTADDYASVGPFKNQLNPYAYLLEGSGTESDPYIITNGVQLARAIATGGMNLYDRLYYCLGNDIDISDGRWITQSPSTSAYRYTYTAFGGSLDGNGYTVTGLSAGDSAAVGLIPVLASGGEVKNLHIRNACVTSSDYAGAIVGEQQSGSTVTGCSVENLTVISGKDGKHIIGKQNGTYNTGYFITADGDYAYVDENGNAYDSENLSTMPITENWYKGVKNDRIDGMPRLANFNSHAGILDVDGDGIADEKYSATDLTALRYKLLGVEGYENINGDVSHNGKVNISDLAIMQRTITDTYGNADSDSFFANVKKGRIKIYYGENDNYDAARKIELYLEHLFPGVDVQKCVSTSKGTVSGVESDSTKVYVHDGDTVETPDGKLEIIVGNIDNYTAYNTNTDATADNTYAVTYDKTNKVVWLQGTNFTAVYQAVCEFVNGCDVNGDKVYTVGSTELADEKKPITVKIDTNYDGTIDTEKTYYYAWGDEFDGDTLDTYNWTHNNQQTEGQNGSDSEYNNLEVVPVKDLNKVVVVKDGKLSLKRAHDSKLNSNDVSYNGTVGSVAIDVTPGEDNGYYTLNTKTNAIDTDGSDQYFTSGKVTTERGMLFKQGYIEFEGQLPADGHAFPAWWLMGRPATSQNNTGYTNSLFGKVYKTNDKWNGSNTYTATNLDSYKYQIPSAIYEIDIIEVMQHSDRHNAKVSSLINIRDDHNGDAYKTSTEAVYIYRIDSTIHKWWNNGVATVKDGDKSVEKLFIQDWDNYKVVNLDNGITNSDFATTTEGWIHNIGSTIQDFGTTTTTTLLTQTKYYSTESKNDTAHNNLTAKRKYGFSWNTDGKSGFEATLYIYNTDGTLDTTIPFAASAASSQNAFKDKNGKTEANGAIGSNASIYSDAKVFNQYMYILFDNKYYSSNPNISDTTKNMYTDLLSDTGLKSFEIDYIRVYQEDGKRDIVTQETEAFNNNNHFGY